jgi:hypothetical protein
MTNGYTKYLTDCIRTDSRQHAREAYLKKMTTEKKTPLSANVFDLLIDIVCPRKDTNTNASDSTLIDNVYRLRDNLSELVHLIGTWGGGDTVWVAHMLDFSEKVILDLTHFLPAHIHAFRDAEVDPKCPSSWIHDLNFMLGKIGVRSFCLHVHTVHTYVHHI